MIIDGKKLAQEIENDLSAKCKMLPRKKVVFVMFGDNAASRQFMGIKSRVAERIGIDAEIKTLPETTTTDEAILFVSNLQGDFDGIVIQLPLPGGIDTQKIINSVPVEKDIDVLSDQAKQSYQNKTSNMIPPVAAAVWEILKYAKVNLEDKNIVLVGNGKLVGEPVSMMLKRENISFSIVDVNTNIEDRDELLLNADIIISGVGVPSLIKPDMIKSRVILIDAGTSEQAGKLAGDIDPKCAEKASFMTPVPGGVGPITVVSLFKNLLN